MRNFLLMLAVVASAGNASATVTSTDRCYGKACRVKSVTWPDGTIQTTAASGTGGSSQWLDGGTSQIYYPGQAAARELMTDGGVNFADGSRQTVAACTTNCSLSGTTTLSAVTVSGALSGATGSFSGAVSFPAGINQTGISMGDRSRILLGGPGLHLSGDSGTAFLSGNTNIGGHLSLTDRYLNLYGDGAGGAGAQAFIWNASGNPLTVNDAQGLGIVGVTLASLAACNSTSPLSPGGTRSALQYTTDLGTYYYCNGTANVELMTQASTTAAITAQVSTAYQKSFAWGSTCFGVCGEDSSFAGPLHPEYAAFTRRVNCSAGTAGTGGATGVVIQLWNETDSVEVATAASTCTAAAGAPFSNEAWATPVTLATNKVYSVRMKGTTDCSLNPANVVCNVVFSQ